MTDRTQDVDTDQTLDQPSQDDPSLNVGPDLDSVAELIEGAKEESVAQKKGRMTGSDDQTLIRGAASSKSEAGIPASNRGGVPERFGRYNVKQEIARGAFGVVYRARDPELNRDVALKVLIAGKHASENEIKRFQIEAQAAAKLRHPGIVPIHEMGIHDGKHFFTLDFIEGSDLRATVEEKPRIARVVKLMIDIASAVQYAHEEGIIHRDLKPGNILLDKSGRPAVTDFGLARNVQSDSQMTRSGDVIGTPAYMSPEQARGETGEIDEQSDVYALGAILFELLTGRAPFVAKGLMALLLEIHDKEPESPAKLNPKVDRDLATICLKCLEKAKGRRYRSAAALKDDLERYQRGEVITAKPVTPSEVLWKWVKRNRALSWVVVGSAAILLAGAIWAFLAINQKRIEAETERERAEDNLEKYLKSDAQRKDDQVSAAPSLVTDAQSLVNKREFEKALELVSIAVGFSPKLVEARLLKAQLLIHKREYETALPELLAFLKIKPDDKDAIRLAEACKKAIAKTPGYEPTAEIKDIFFRQKAYNLAADMSRSSAEKLRLYRAKLDSLKKGWGKNLFLGSKGRLHFNGARLGPDLSPLAGLPLTSATLIECTVTDLLPLQGMPLRTLSLKKCSHIRDLSVLEGMQIAKLDLSGEGPVKMRVQDLSPLRGMPLRWLNLDKCYKVRDLSPLSGMPLSYLNIGQTAVGDLSPLERMSLTYLRMFMCTKISDITPLRGMPLKSLHLGAGSTYSQNHVADISPLKGMHTLVALDLSGCRYVKDLMPLQGMHLKSLNLHMTKVSDLSPLRDMPIQTLVLGGNYEAAPVRDLSPLRGMPLKYLDLCGSTLIRDLTPLLECSQLTHLILPRGIKDIDCLLGMSSLKFLGIKFQEKTPVKEFFKKWRAAQAKNRAAAGSPKK